MAKLQTILCVDDEQNILDLLQFNLESNGYAVVTASNGADAIASAPGVDLVLLDLMLPDIDGITVCKTLKGNPITESIPVIMLTAKDDETDKVLGLELGADDYITKPFSIRELLARVKALLRRMELSNPATAGKIINGPITIDCDNYEAFRNGEKLFLTLKEYETLKFLAEHIGKVCTRDSLLDRIWGYDFYGETRTVDVHIRHIRSKLGEDAKLIETVRGVGYKMVGA